MNLLFSFKARISDNGFWLKIDHLIPVDADDFIDFLKWDSIVEDAARKCAKEKSGNKFEFNYLGTDYVMDIVTLDDESLCNFKFDVYI